jgi:hypothetical protein
MTKRALLPLEAGVLAVSVVLVPALLKEIELNVQSERRKQGILTAQCSTLPGMNELVVPLAQDLEVLDGIQPAVLHCDLMV